MRSKLYSVAGTIFLAGSLYFAFHHLKSSSQFKREPFLESDEGAAADQPDKAAMYEIGRTLDPLTKTVPRERLEIARQIQLKSFADQRASKTFSTLAGLGWSERGPDNVGGRTRAVMYDRNDVTANKVWAGGVGGGLWWTNNITAATPVWNKVSDTLNRLCITCITQSQTSTTKNKMFFGTGEGWFNFDAMRGNGIWRSLDAGAHWQQLPSTKNNPNFTNVLDLLYADVAVCFPQETGILAATDSGVFKSTDDGDSWTKVLGKGIAGANINAAADLKTAYYWTYATLGKLRNAGGGIWRSCNAGATWERIYQAGSDEERIEVSPHYLDGWELWALVQGVTSNGRPIKRIMKTSNADTMPASAVIWTDKTLPPWCDAGAASSDFTRGQGWYDLTLACAPIFSNPPANTHTFTAYIGGVDLLKTTNNGASFPQISQWYTGCGGQPQVHADIHNLVFKPDLVNGGYFPDEFLVATDGGIYRSTNGGGSFSSRNKTYNVTQFYSVAIHPTLPNYFLAGAQDNGTQKFTASGMNTTTNIIASDFDGGYCFIDQDNPMIQIAAYVNNKYLISTDGGSNFVYLEKNDRGEFINPMDYDNTANILYAGNSPGTFFRYINPGGGGGGITEQVSVPQFGSDSVTFVLISPTVANRVFFGLGNGAIVQVDGANAGNPVAGVVIRPDIGAFHTVSCISIDPSNQSHMLVSYSNYGVTSVYESSAGTGGSLDWTSVDGNGSLPDMPIRWCMFDPRNSDWAILGTELGVWSTSNLNGMNTNWTAADNNVANTRVDMLRFRASDRLLAAATHGRGLFTTNVPAAAVPITLLDFNGKLVNNDIWVDWKTANEQNSKQFNIERSDDGINFRTVGSTAAAGYSNSDRSYSFHDLQIAQEKNYYRLKEVDLDGKFEYSKIILLKKVLIGKEPFKVLTNPFAGNIDIELRDIERGKAIFRLFDMSGHQLLNRTELVNPISRIRLDVSSSVLPAGVYNLEMILNGKRYGARVVRR